MLELWYYFLIPAIFVIIVIIDQIMPINSRMVRGLAALIVGVILFLPREMSLLLPSDTLSYATFLLRGYRYLFPAIFGIVILIRGQIMLTNRRMVRGSPSRIIGVLLLLPLLMMFSVMPLLAYLGLAFKPAVYMILVFYIIIALCFVAVIRIAIDYSEPIPKRRVDDVIGVVDKADHYREHFQPTDEPAHRLNTPDDRIQH